MSKCFLLLNRVKSREKNFTMLFRLVTILLRTSKMPQGTENTYFYDIETKTFVFHSNTKFENCRIKIFNLVGNLLRESQPFQISEGINKVVFPSSMISNSATILQIVDSKGNIVFFGKEILR